MNLFSFGADQWPGIAKLVEETGEVNQVCGKLMMTGGEVEHWDGTNLKVRLEEEIADVLAACKFVEKYCELDSRVISIRTIEKFAAFIHWREEERKK